MKNLIILLLILSACGSNAGGTIVGEASLDPTKKNPVTSRNDTLIVGSPEMSGNFLPAYYTTAYDAQVTGLIFEGLYSGDSNGNILPNLAEALPQISNNGTVYTVTINKGIFFHSGKELTADDVVFSYTLLADPSYDGRFSSVVSDMVGYQEYSQGSTNIFAGVTKIDEYTVQFRFKEQLFSNIATLTFPIMDSVFYAYSYGDTSSVKNKNTQLVGTGAYKLINYVPKQYAELSKNESYWDKQPNIPNIIIKTVAPVTDVQELIKGDIDVLPNVIEPEKLLEADRTGYINRNQYLRHGYGYIMFNSSAAPTDDKKVRQALVYGLNREAIIQIYFKDLAKVLDVPTSSLFWTYDEELESRLVRYSYDPEKASKLLDEAGWILIDGKRMKNGQEMILDWVSIKDFPFVDVMSPIVIDNYSKLGITVRLTQIDFTSLIDKVYNERSGFNMFNMALSESLLPAPYNVWHSSLNKRGGSNTGQYVNPKADELLDRMKRTLDKNEFKSLWQEFIILLNDEMPIMPIYVNTYSDLYNRRVKNFNTSSLYDWTGAIMEAELVSETN